MARKIKIDNSILKRRAYKKRSHEPVEAICKILIVCEGSKTEPNYFGEFNKKKRVDRDGYTVLYEKDFAK